MWKEYRCEELKNIIYLMNIRPIDIMVTGATGAGKSSTLNALFGNDITKVGEGTEPETMGIDSYELNDLVRFWDTPGLGDGLRDSEHKQKIRKMLKKTYGTNGKEYGWIDLVLLIIEGSTARDLGTVFELLNKVIIPNIQKERILVAINQCDLAMKGQHWDKRLRQPDRKLKEFLDELAVSIQRRVKESTHVDIIKPVYYSSEYNYNLNKLMDLIVDNLPRKKRN